jgi:hypothetical protein
MKKRYLVGIILLLMCSLLYVIPFTHNFASWAKTEAIKVFINNTPSKLVPVSVKGTMYQPLYFPVSKGDSSWQVNLSYDSATKTLKINKISSKVQTRDKSDCEYCKGTGECQRCYPAGSGDDIQGNACPVCNGTGDCTWCKGSGEK